MLVAIAALQTSPKTATKNMTMRLITAGSRLHEASRTGDIIGQNDPTRGSSQMLGMPGFSRFGEPVDLVSSNHLLFWGGAIAASVSPHRRPIAVQLLDVCFVPRSFSPLDMSDATIAFQQQTVR